MVPVERAGAVMTALARSRRRASLLSISGSPARVAQNRRSGGRGGMRRGGGGAPLPFVPLASGTFARALVAYQRNSDPTSGAFYAQVAANALRYETLTSGGRLALIEGARTNNVKNSRDRAAAGWNAGSLVTETASQTGIDGVASAYREEVSSGGFARFPTTIATAGPFVASQWEKRGGSNTTYHSQVSNGAFIHAESPTGLLTTWLRTPIRAPSGTSGNYILTDGRTGVVDTGTGPRDTVSDFPQIETGRFASSPILNDGATGKTRPADTLTWAAAPAGLLSDTHGFRHVRPIWYSTLEVADADEFWLMSIVDGSNGVRIKQTAGVITIEAVAGGVVKASSPPFTTLADTDLGSVVWAPAAGLVYLNGTAGPAGAAWAWGAGALRIGGVYGAASEAFCGLSDIY